MDWKRKKKALMGFVGGLGVVVFVAGVIGGYYAPATAIVGALAVWIIGATLVIVLAA